MVWATIPVLYFREKNRAENREATQFSTTKRSQPRQNIAAPMHRDGERENVVNTRGSDHSTPADLNMLYLQI